MSVSVEVATLRRVTAQRYRVTRPIRWVNFHQTSIRNAEYQCHVVGLRVGANVRVGVRHLLVGGGGGDAPPRDGAAHLMAIGSHDR